MATQKCQSLMVKTMATCEAKAPQQWILVLAVNQV
jgi:hypothetical protein